VIAVLGAGLTGLSFAYHFGDGCIVFEKEATVGGAARTYYKGGYTFDAGPHTLFGRDPYFIKLIERLLGYELPVQKRRCRIFSHGVYTKYPFQANTYGLPVDVVKDCLMGFIEATYAQHEKPTNYRVWLEQTYGAGFARHFFIPHSIKMWNQQPESMAVDWVDPRFPRPSLADVVEGALHELPYEFGPNAEFRYPIKGGIGTISMALASQVRVQLQKETKHIDVENKTILFKDGEKFSYDKLISSIPLCDLVRQLKGPVPEHVSRAAANLRHISDLLIFIGVSREDVLTDHWAYFLDRDTPFLRLSAPSNFSRYNVPSGNSSLLADVMYGPKSTIDRSSIVRRSIDSLIRLGLLRGESEIDRIEVVDKKHAYILHTLDRTKNVSAIKEYLEKKGIYLSGMHGEWKYSWMHDAILGGKALAEQLKERGDHVLGT
jgi:UDP-galactopyranose mutase